MSHGEHPPRLRMTAVVKPRHGRKFVQEWIKLSYASGALGEAFDATHVVRWPLSTNTLTPAQARFHDIEHEIVRRTVDEVQDAIAEAFVRIATEVLDRERRRDAPK